MKKLVSILIGFILSIAVSGLITNVAGGIREEKQAEIPTVSITKGETINEGTALYTLARVELDGQYILEMDGTSTPIGSECGVEQIIFEGKNGTAIKLQGSGYAPIHAANGGKLTFRNVTFRCDVAETYVRFSGKLRFENCIFTKSVYFTDDVDVQFIACDFNSSVATSYSCWIADGTASFKNCAFLGTRALKTHEFDGENVERIIVDECQFLYLTDKPGVVIGVVDSTTVIEIRNSVFKKCKAWDTVGSIEGIDGFYEADVFTTEFTFINVNNNIEF